MINGDAGEFIDRIYSCQNTVFIYNSIKYWFQGYMPTANTVHMEVAQVDPAQDDFVWECNGTSISEGQKAFQEAPFLTAKPSGKLKRKLSGQIIKAAFYKRRNA